MANNNRTEVSAAIQALAAVVGESEFKTLIDDNFSQSVMFRKDVSTTTTATASTKTINFLDYDYIVCTQTASATEYTLNNIQQGEIKYLKIIKSTVANQEVSFASPIVDTSQDLEAIDGEQDVTYMIVSKDGTNIYAIPISPYYTASRWQTPSYGTGFSAGSDPFQYRLRNGNLEFRGGIVSGGTVGSPFTLPVGYRPAIEVNQSFVSGSNDVSKFTIATTGVVSSNDWSASNDNEFNNIIIMD